MEKSKRCTKCGEVKDAACFRVRTEKRASRGSGNFKYLNNVCKECDKLIALEYYNKHRDEDWFKKKNCNNANRYAKENRDSVNAKKKVYREKPQNRIHRKIWLSENKKEVNKKRRVGGASKKYSQKIIANLTDVYVVRHLSGGKDKRRFLAENAPELIELRRQQIKFHRLIKQKST